MYWIIHWINETKNKPTRQSINVQTFLYPYKHVSQYSPHTHQTRKPNDTRNDTRPLDKKPSQTRPHVREKTIPKKQWADNAHVTLPSALNVILSEVGSGKGKTKNELGGKQLYRPQPIKRTDIIKKSEKRETEHDNQKMKKKTSIKGRPTKRGDGPRWRNRWSATKKMIHQISKKISRTEGHAHMPNDYD